MAMFYPALAVVVLSLAASHGRVLQQVAVPPTAIPSLGDLTGLPILPALGSFVFPNGTVCQNSGIGNIGCGNDGSFNIGVNNTGSFNKGNVNLGNFNEASANNGNFNKGNANAGSYNTGSQNNGNSNSGNQNDGTGNSGNQNTGSYNSGTANNGIANSGTANNGNFNSGDTNNGSGNNGTSNNGDGNLGSYNTGSFNTLSYQTGSYISPNGTVVLYPLGVPGMAPSPGKTPSKAAAAVANPPTLSDLVSSVFGGSLQPITSTTSLGSLIDGLTGGSG